MNNNFFIKLKIQLETLDGVSYYLDEYVAFMPSYLTNDYYLCLVKDPKYAFPFNHSVDYFAENIDTEIEFWFNNLNDNYEDILCWIQNQNYELSYAIDFTVVQIPYREFMEKALKGE